MLQGARRRLHAVRERYEGEDERPLGGYSATMTVYAAAVGAAGLLLRATGHRLPARLESRDLVLLGVATHKMSRLLAKDPITSPLRAPFTRYEGTAGPSEVAEGVAGAGSRKAVGELITCPFCTAQWVATGLAFGLAVAPRPTRFLAGVFTTVAVSDWLQLVYATLQQRAESG